MEYYALLSIPVISVFSVLILFILAVRKCECHLDYSQTFPVIDLVKKLGKICPLNSSNNWELLSTNFGLNRSWKQNLPFPVFNKVHLYGSYAVVNCASENAFAFISDVSKWPEWDPYNSVQYLTKSFHDNQLKQDKYMDAKQIIHISRENNILPQTIMYRFHKFYENEVGWILFICVKNFDFMFFLIQPDKLSTSKSVITHITGTASKHDSSLASIVVQRLRNIQDIISFSSLSLMPLVLFEFKDSKYIGGSTRTSHNYMNKCRFQNYLVSQKGGIPQTVFLLVPYFSSWLIWTSFKGFKLGVKGSVTSVPNSNAIPRFSRKERSPYKKSVPKNILRRTVSDLTVKQHNSPVSTDEHVLSSSTAVSDIKKCTTDKPSFDLSEDSETKQRAIDAKNCNPRSKLRSFSETAVDELENNESDILDDKTEHSSKHLHDIKEVEENNVLFIDKQDQSELFNSSISDFEILETTEFSENIIAGFMTHGNYGASELQAEYLLASQFDVENPSFSGGWVLHSFYKGLLVLSKNTRNEVMNIVSYMCQTVINVPPKDIWKFVKNPQFRFICDETVKSVDVIEKLSSSQKLIHTYHETTGILRKEYVDFCLLQTEREELNRYYSCFNSIEYHKCPLLSSVTRGSLRPSGWIVEAADNDPNSSKVIYLVQILINSPDSLFIQDMGNLVPQSVYNLRNYISTKPV